MLKIGFNGKYKVLHFTNEIGGYIIGGIATFIEQLYKFHEADEGFVHIYDGDILDEIDIRRYPGDRDILAIDYREIGKLSRFEFDIGVIHFYGLDYIMDSGIFRDKKIVYVIHSVPTPEPYFLDNPFGGHIEVQRSFERLCEEADILVCVSNCEREKLIRLYPRYDSKTRVIYNGIDMTTGEVKKDIREGRSIFGFLGRLDYRKGLLECLKEFRDVEGKLMIACDNQDIAYMGEIISFIDGAKLWDKVEFIGWVSGKRKENFLKAIDALIVPSLYEPFGYVVLEAGRLGTPVISSCRGGIYEIVGDEYRYVFDPYERGRLTECIRRFQRDSVDIVEKEVSRLTERVKMFSAEKMV